MPRDEPRKIDSVHTILTPKPPCCLEPCPLDPNFVAVGTYNLIRDEGDAENDEAPAMPARDGAVMIYKVVDDELQLLQSIDLPFAILDLHWVKYDDTIAILGAAGSTGTFALFKATLGLEQPFKMAWIQTLQLEGHDVVITSFAWRLRDAGIVYTTASGDVNVLPAILSAGQLSRSVASALHHEPLTLECTEDSEQLASHDLEAWVVALDQADGGAWSGGDDAVLSWAPFSSLESAEDAEMSAPTEQEPPSVHPKWSNRKIHGAGVTALLPLVPGILLTGSYDDNLRVLSMPSSVNPRPRLFAQAYLGGGVWRMYVIGSAPDRVEEVRKVKLLVCCMYAGAKIIELEMHEDGDWPIQTLARFEEHESMCYDGAVIPTPSGHGTDSTLVTCSFYDQRLCLWRI